MLYELQNFPLNWHFLDHTNVPRQPQDIFVEPFVREALVRLNPEIAAQPDRAEEVLYELRSIIRSARSEGLIKANETMTTWFRNDKTMPFGENHEHCSVKLFDFEHIENNQFIVTTDYHVQGESGSLTADLVLLVNGFPLVIIEAKPPPRPSVTWYDRAVTIRQEYEKNVPELFVCNVLNVATDGRQLRYGSIGMPENLWGPWREIDEPINVESAATVTQANLGMLEPKVLLDILENFTLFAVNDKKRLIKVICRYQQYQATNLIVERVLDPEAPKKGLIWHFQGSGKSYLMVFAARKLRYHPQLNNPAVLIVVDRVDLNSQILKTFHGAKVENLTEAKTRAELKTLLKAGTRKVIITTIFRFGDESAKQEANRLLRWTQTKLKKKQYQEAEAHLIDCADLLASLKPEDCVSLQERFDALKLRFEELTSTTIPLPEPQVAIDEASEGETAHTTPIVALNPAENVIVLVDEAHRTQEGDLGLKMKGALPNASFFGLTGTPINKRDRNTFMTFGAECDEGRYMHRYGFEDSIRDGATLPLHFVPRKSEFKVDQESLKEEFAKLTGHVSEVDTGEVVRQATRFGVVVKAPGRVSQVIADVVADFNKQVRPRGLAAMVVTYDQEACLLYKAELDKHLDPAVSDVVISAGQRSDEAYQAYHRDRQAEEQLLDRFRDPADPLKILIVTAKLLTGFDAPIVQTMYLDRPLKDHTLLQAICRTNRVYNETKQSGIIIDYLGLFDETANALKFDEVDVSRMVQSINKVKEQLPEALTKCLDFFEGVDRSLDEQQSNVAALNKLGSLERCDEFGKHFRYLSKIWEVISPDPILAKYIPDYTWLTQRYKAIRQSGGGGGGQQVWQELGPQTTQLLYKHLSFNISGTELEDIVLNDELFAVIQQTEDPDQAARDLTIKLEDYLKDREGDPQIPELAEKLTRLKARYENGTIQALEYIRKLLELAKQGVEIDQQNQEAPEEPEVAPEEMGKAMLTRLFEEIKSPEMPIQVEKVVHGIDEVVRAVRFDGWNNTESGRREVSKKLRIVIFKNLGNADPEIHRRALAYVEKYY